jgi:hypothetical protein
LRRTAFRISTGRFCSIACILAFSLNAAEAACPPNQPDRLFFTFCRDSGGWVGGFADLPTDALEGELFTLSFRRAVVPGQPTPLRGLRLSGANRSDDLFMFLKRQVTGLVPSARYVVDLAATLYTEAGRGCIGAGGAPGEGVTVKAGAVPFEPLAVPENGVLRMNLDKGQQASAGSNAVVLGDLAAAGARCEGGVFVRKRFATAAEAIVGEADRNGNLWLMLGTDSGFEGTTTYFVTALRLQLERLPH